MFIGRLVGEDVPYRNQQVLRDGHHRLVWMHAPRQLVILLLPIGHFLDGHPRGFHQHPAQVFATLFRNSARAMGLTAGVHTRADTRVAH
jgi:hypothetical protein